MKVLITGIAGFVGSHLAELLLAKKNAVYGIDRNKADRCRIGHIKDKISYRECDIKNIISVRRVLKDTKPDIILHLAAQSSPSLSQEMPTATFKTNLMGELNIFEALRSLKLRPRVIIAGSCDEYGFVKSSELPIKETQALRPLNAYAVSKAAQDLLGYQYHKSYGFDVIRARPFHTTGPRQQENFVCSNFARQIALIEKGKQKPVIYVGNLSARRDFTDVRDIAQAYWLLMRKGKAGEAYNICSGKGPSIREVLDILLSLSKVKVAIKVEVNRMRPNDVPVFIGDYAKIRKATGWRPIILFGKTLGDLLDCWRRKV